MSAHMEIAVVDQYMQRALEAAQRGFEMGNLPVGSVVVKGSEIVGVGRNRHNETQDPTTHAELEAIRDAAMKHADQQLSLLEGAVCYTTMMPCAMCAGALIRFGFSKVVVGETTSYQASGSDELMRRQGVEIEIHEHPELIALVERYHAVNESPASRPGRPTLKY